MYSDIIPPKKNNNIRKIEPSPVEEKSSVKPSVRSDLNYDSNSKTENRVLHNEPILTQREIYHTIDGKDKKGNTALILFLIMIAILGIVYYSVFNNKTTITFTPKTTTLEITEKIPVNISTDTARSSSTLPYSLVYNNDNKNRDIFAPLPVPVSTSTATTTSTKTKTIKTVAPPSSPFSTITSTSTNSTKKITFVNNTGSAVSVVKNTRIDVGGVIYYLNSTSVISKNASSNNASTTYKVIGFKGTSKYDKFYGVDYIDTSSVQSNSTANNTVTTTSTSATTDSSNIPNDDLLSLIPDNFIPLKKGFINNKTINQTALVVIDKTDFKNILNTDSKAFQDYIKSFSTISDIVDYNIVITDYTLETSPVTGLPVAFDNITVQITPIIAKDKVASIFKGFSRDAMDQLKTQVQNNLGINVSYSPFWISKVSDEDHITVMVK